MKKLLLLSLAMVVLGIGLVSPAVSAPRKVLVEMFTSTTCSPCYAPDNFYFYQWLPNYGGVDLIVTVAYHVWWPSPGNDPMYLHNPPPVQTRCTNFYANTLAPNLRVDGFINGGSSYSTWPGIIEPRFLDPSPVSIALSGSRTATTMNLRASITADAVVSSGTWRVHWVVTQDGISEPQNSPSGYVPFVHHAVHRNMYPDGNGSTIAITQGQTVHIDRSIPINAAWIANNCKVVVFVQNNTDRKVQNVEVIDVSTLAVVNVGEETGKIPAQFKLEQNYPNPFNPTTNIKYTVPEQSSVSLKIYNTVGQEVRTLLSSTQPAGEYSAQWDGKGNSGVALPSGVYIYKMTAGKFQETRKMLYIK